MKPDYKILISELISENAYFFQDKITNIHNTKLYKSFRSYIQKTDILKNKLSTPFFNFLVYMTNFNYWTDYKEVITLYNSLKNFTIKEFSFKTKSLFTITVFCQDKIKTISIYQVFNDDEEVLLNSLVSSIDSKIQNILPLLKKNSYSILFINNNFKIFSNLEQIKNKTYYIFSYFYIKNNYFDKYRNVVIL